MDTLEEEDPRRCRRPAAVATQHQDSESSPVFDYFSDLEPLNTVRPWLQAGHLGPEREALTVGDVKPLWGSAWTEQAMEEHPFDRQNGVQRFDSFPDVYQDWHQRRSFDSQVSEEARPHHHDPRQQLDFDAVMPCHGSTPRIHHYEYSSGVPPPSLLNQGHPLLSNGGPRESSCRQQISDASKMPLQYPSEQKQLIQMPEVSKSSLPNLGHPLLSNGGLRESSSRPQISDASKMLLQYPSDQKQLIQMPEDSKSSLPNLGHPLSSNGGPRESSSWQQISDASKMPLQQQSDQEQLIQMVEDLKRSLPNLGHPLWSNGRLQESSSWQQISDASKMPLQQRRDQEQLIQMPEDSKSSLRNLRHPLLSSGGLRESSSWQQISDASKMPLQQRSDQEQLIQMPEDLKISSVFSNPNLKVSNLVGDGQHGDGATTTLKSWSNGNASKSQDHNGVAEPNPVTPRRGRRKAANATENGSSVRCNCRRSRCLKLYCECFAAGVYCIESCACKDCYNHLDFEDTVLETRRQIESRCPFAFGPKVVQHAINSPPDKAEGSGSEATPSSVRHKRGCNCKKSQCLKKYCECYQAKAGCFHECNCADCCNPFSPKSAEQSIKSGEMTPHEKLDSMQDMPNSSETGTGSQSASTQEGTVNSLNNTPSSSPLACSNHPHTRGSSSSAQAKRRQGSVPLHLPGSPVKIPPSDRDKASHDLVGVSPKRDMAKGAKISAMDKSSLLKPANAGSPNQRQVSTPQFQSPGRSPSISPSSRRARKPDSQNRPPPDGKSKGSSSEA